ncbi:MAG: NBR1-Ig-like domain-containing protein [Anaerolineales bacterium]
MNNKNFKKIAGCLVSVLFLPACAFTPPPVQVSEPRSMEVLGMIVQTAAAAQTQTATALRPPTSTLTPSLTPTLPTPTATFFFSLFTSTPVNPSDSGNIVEGGDSSAFSIPYTGKPWTCVVRAKSHPKGAVVAAGKSFVAYWTVINTGTKTWTGNTIDFVYKSGYRHDGKLIQDLSSTVAPGRQAAVGVSFTAPNTEGEYTAIWTLKVGNHPFCGMKITFEVKK